MLDARALQMRAERSWLPKEPPYIPMPPDCFPSRQQYVLWLEVWTQREDQESGFCVDCTKEHQEAMFEKGKCAFPNTTFGVDADGFRRGIR